MNIKTCFLSGLLLVAFLGSLAQKRNDQVKTSKPNVIYIMTDDLGYGDLSCYGATKIHTPNLDKLAASGIRFTNGHCTSATCTPSRYALMTGTYPWRKQGTGILPGDAALIIPTDRITLPKVFQKAGYETGIVGKWHLGLGEAVEKNWNGEIKPGPNEVGFDYSFIFPATADRVPIVFLENHKVVGLDAKDSIVVSYVKKIGSEPTGKEQPELLKLNASPNHGHDGTIVNGIGRIGFMSGGKQARWVDEEVSTTFLAKAQDFIEKNKQKPFFLYLATTEPHVPRMPATRFKGASGLGLRGDAILQLDWTVGEIMKQLAYLKLDKNTMIIFSSDNGPVLDDGYQDEAVTRLNGHTPSGPIRGGKYSATEGGTRVPFIISWPEKIKPEVSGALVSQIDMLASFAAFTNQTVPAGDAMDSENFMDTFLGNSKKGRSVNVKQGGRGLTITKDGWKYIPANNGVVNQKAAGATARKSVDPQLYNLNEDIGEKHNLASKFPDKVKELQTELTTIQEKK